MSSFCFFIVFMMSILSDQFIWFNKFSWAKIQQNTPFVKVSQNFYLAGIQCFIKIQLTIRLSTVNFRVMIWQEIGR